jgi:hypothetical protein
MLSTFTTFPACPAFPPTAMMKRRQHQQEADNLQGEGDGLPLDDTQQEEVVRELYEQYRRQSHTFRLIFGAGGMCLGVFFSHAAIQQHLHPWEARYTGELRTVTRHDAVVASLALQVG